jgi:hypothetical protein
MPSLKNSLVSLSGGYSPVKPTTPIAPAQPVSAPTQANNFVRNTLMISSLPSISTNVDGIVRQFYGGRPLPTRRLILPS